MRFYPFLLVLMFPVLLHAQKPDDVAPAKNFAWRVGGQRGKLLNDFGGPKEAEGAVEKGLAWLASQQNKDGSWKCDGHEASPVAGTALAVLPFLGAGHGAKGHDTKYGPVVRSAINYLLK